MCATASLCVCWYVFVYLCVLIEVCVMSVRVCRRCLCLFCVGLCLLCVYIWVLACNCVVVCCCHLCVCVVCVDEDCFALVLVYVVVVFMSVLVFVWIIDVVPLRIGLLCNSWAPFIAGNSLVCPGDNTDTLEKIISFILFAGWGKIFLKCWGEEEWRNISKFQCLPLKYSLEEQCSTLI